MVAGEHRAGYGVRPLFTVGESIRGYRLPGRLDGMAAFELDATTTRIFVSHELQDAEGYSYTTVDVPALTGARVSFLDVDRRTRAIVDAGLAYRRIRDRQGRRVVDPAQINEDAQAMHGFDRFCSAQGYVSGQYRFVDDIFFTCEEASALSGHPHGGSIWALDIRRAEIWALPRLGRGAWENVAALDTPNRRYVAMLLGDDRGGAPLYLWVGLKDGKGTGTFPDRNGLSYGGLYVWRSYTGDLDPDAFNGTGAVREGEFVPIAVRDPAQADSLGYDAEGYLDDYTLRDAADSLGAFSFSRPEDLHTNPDLGTQAVLASTGLGSVYPSDDWGTIYLVDMEMGIGDSLHIEATISILHDSDDFGDHGIRSPDNLTWAEDGYIYVQEDRSTQIDSFGEETGIEASVWRLDPVTGDHLRVAVVDRAVVAPAGSTDADSSTIGAWESSGIIDVSRNFDTARGELLLLGTVQAHTVNDSLIGGGGDLVESGQIYFVNRWDRIATE